jgi:hypothetical protein
MPWRQNWNLVDPYDICSETFFETKDYNPFHFFSEEEMSDRVNQTVCGETLSYECVGEPYHIEYCVLILTLCYLDGTVKQIRRIGL